MKDKSLPYYRYVLQYINKAKCGTISSASTFTRRNFKVKIIFLVGSLKYLKMSINFMVRFDSKNIYFKISSACVTCI